MSKSFYLLIAYLIIPIVLLMMMVCDTNAESQFFHGASEIASLHEDDWDDKTHFAIGAVGFALTDYYLEHSFPNMKPWKRKVVSCVTPLLFAFTKETLYDEHYNQKDMNGYAAGAATGLVVKFVIFEW